MATVASTPQTGTSCKFCVKHGNSLAHVGTLQDATTAMLLFNGQSTASCEHLGCSCTSGERLLEFSASSSQRILSCLVKAFPLVGPATRSFATALRVDVVRKALSQHTVRGEPLLKVQGWVAKAADAQRHFTISIIDESVHIVRNEFGGDQNIGSMI